MTQPVIGFIGGGNMGSALVGGLVDQGYDARCIWVSDHHKAHLTALEKQYGVHTTQDNREVMKGAEVLVFSVKPPVVRVVCEDLAKVLNDTSPLVVSVAAGIRCESIQGWLSASSPLPIVRCMPNTPALIRRGAMGLFATDSVTKAQCDQVQSLFESVGKVVWVESEDDIDAVTALSGSGPAYFFLMLESMVAAGVKLGLQKQVAKTLAIQTALGAAKMAEASEEGLATLRERVTSPGGTTAAALQVFQEEGFSELVEKALTAAWQRSKALGNE